MLVALPLAALAAMHERHWSLLLLLLLTLLLAARGTPQQAAAADGGAAAEAARGRSGSSGRRSSCGGGGGTAATQRCGILPCSMGGARRPMGPALQSFWDNINLISIRVRVYGAAVNQRELRRTRDSMGPIDLAERAETSSAQKTALASTRHREACAYVDVDNAGSPMKLFAVAVARWEGQGMATMRTFCCSTQKKTRFARRYLHALDNACSTCFQHM